MAGLTFSLFAGGLAQRAIVAIDDRTETLAGPNFSIAGSNAAITQASFQQIDFPGRVLTAPAFGDAGVAALTINDRSAEPDSPFDADRDGRVETISFALNPAVEVSPHITVTATDADLVTLSGWSTVNVQLGSSGGAVFDVTGAREGLFSFGAEDDALALDTGAGTGLLQVASGAGDDDIGIASGSFYAGDVHVVLGNGDDTVRIDGGDDGNFHILAASSGAEVAADAPVSSAATNAATPAIFPPLPPDAPLDVVADGGAGADRFVLTQVAGRVTGGAGADIFELDFTEALTVVPGAGADTVVLRNGASATIEIARTDTGTTEATADTLRFSATSVSSSTIELTGFATGATARVVPDEPPPADNTFQPLQDARLLIEEPGAATPQVVDLIGVNTDPLEGLTVLFT